MRAPSLSAPPSFPVARRREEERWETVQFLAVYLIAALLGST